MTDGSLTETDGKTQRVTVTDGSLTETDGSLTDMHGSGGQWSQRRWAAVMWILGLSWGRCPGVPLSRCAGVPVMAVVYQYTGVPMLPLISLWFPFDCPMCLPELSYDFLQLPIFPFQFPRMFVWFSCERPLEFL